MSSLIKLLANDSFIVVSREIARLVGLEAAVMLGELASEYNHHKGKGNIVDGGFFYSTLSNIEKNTTLTRKRQDKAIKILKDKGLIEVKLRDIPAKRFFRINEANLMKMLSEVEEKEDIEEAQEEDIKAAPEDDYFPYEAEPVENKGANKFVPMGQTGLSERDKLDCPSGATNNNNINNNKNNNINTYVNQVIDAYEQICFSLPRITKVTEKRRRLIKARLKDGFTIDDFKKAFSKAEASAFLRGETGDRRFRASFDWLLNESNLVKVLEGNYDRSPGGNDGRGRAETKEEREARERRQWSLNRAEALAMANSLSEEELNDLL